MKVFIVLVPIDKNSNARKHCEMNENQNFKTTIEIQKKFGKDAIIQDISDFMDDFNNQEINEANFFMTYVTLTT